jgi:hypothetical protein
MNASLDSGESIGSEKALDHPLRSVNADIFLCVSMHYYNSVGFSLTRMPARQIAPLGESRGKATF